jgi:hypothetical protein
MALIDIFIKLYDILTVKSASLTSFIIGIMNLCWIYLFDRLSDGKLITTRAVSIREVVVIANITQWALILMLVASVFFGVIAIRKALSTPSSKDNHWAIFALIGILLGILPLAISAYAGKIWFRTLFIGYS